MQEIFQRLKKLKEKAASAPDIDSLEQISNKVNKIRGKLTQQNGNRQISAVLDKISQLISEKYKYFKQKVIRDSKKFINIDQQSSKNQQANRTLKYSKSAQNLKPLYTRKPTDTMTVNRNINKTSKIRIQGSDSFQTQKTNKINRQKTTFVRNTKDKSNQQMSQFLQTASLNQHHSYQLPPKVKSSRIASKQGISMKNIQKNTCQDQNIENVIVNPFEKQRKRVNGQIDFLEQKLSYSFKKIQDLSKKVSALQAPSPQPPIIDQSSSPMAKAFLAKQEIIVDQYSQKLRQKGFIIQDLKAKLEYFKAMNQELKNRLVNQQRRNEDYIEGLKLQIKNCKRELENYKKENQELNAQLQDFQQKNNSLLNQVKKLISKLQQQAKSKQSLKRQLSASSSIKIQQLQKQIKTMSGKCLNLQKLQLQLQQQIQHKNSLCSIKNGLQGKINQLEQDLKKSQGECERIEQQMHRKQQQIQLLKSQLKIQIQSKQILAQQLLQIKDRLDEQIRINQLKEYENDLKVKGKLGKLREIKSLLSQLK